MAWLELKPEEIRIERRDISVPRLQVLPDGTLHIIVPHGAAVGPLIDENTHWIRKRITEVRRLAEEYAGQESGFLLNGVYYAVRQGAYCKVNDDTGVITYTTPPDLKRMLFRNVKSDISAAVRNTAPSLGVEYRKICVRMQKTRWASCSSRGTLSFNVMLAALPERLRTYIVMHELVHLMRHDHSPSFWKILEEHFSGARAADQELRKYWILIGRNRYWQVIQEIGRWENAYRRGEKTEMD